MTKTATKDTKLTVCKGMTLTVKEVRGSSTLHAYKEGYEEVSKDTKTRFHWKLDGLASKLGADVINSEAFDPREQEVYNLVITSHCYDIGHAGGFKSREVAIRNAVDFAERNGIEVDGYKATKTKDP